MRTERSWSVSNKNKPQVPSTTNTNNNKMSSNEIPQSTASAASNPPSALPPGIRVRLYELFVQIEREFEILYAENMSLQVRITRKASFRVPIMICNGFFRCTWPTTVSADSDHYFHTGCPSQNIKIKRKSLVIVDH